MNKFMLPREFLENWIDSLKSGKYKQGQGVLLDCDDQWEKTPPVKTMCCLGVACSMLGMTDENLERKELPRDYTEETLDSYNVPRELRKYNDLGTLVGILTELNDGYTSKKRDQLIHTFPDIRFEPIFEGETQRRYSFVEIADWLELNVEGY